MNLCDFDKTDNGILHAQCALKSLRAILDIDNDSDDSDVLAVDDDNRVDGEPITTQELLNPRDDELSVVGEDKIIALREQLVGLEEMLKIVMDERFARSLLGLPGLNVEVEVNEESMDILRRVIRMATDIVSSEMECPNSDDDDDDDDDDEGNVLQYETSHTRYVQSDAQNTQSYSLEGPLSPLTESESSSSTSNHSNESDLESYPPCIICGTDIPPTHCVEMPCGHIYCPECTKQLVKTYISQPFPNTLFRCCPHPKPPISTQTINQFIRPSLLKNLEAKLKEANIPFNQRIYCPQENCRRFIKPERITLIAKRVGYIHCPNIKCKVQICLDCKALVHTGVDCDTHADNSQAKVIQRQFGWGRCPGCRFVVEKISGCNEILCTRCGNSFSYT